MNPTDLLTGSASPDPRSGPAPLESPLRAPLAFRVGVIGHRPNRLQQANLALLRQRLSDLLDVVRELVMEAFDASRDIYRDSPPRLRALSPLAEGTDRLFAESALGLGFELCCVMPFAQAEFENDFSPAKASETDSLSRFRNLLERAGKETRLACFEMDGSRADEPAAYAAAGRVILNQSDLLVVVWDGERRNKRGGTEETFDAARRQGIPILWIDAHAPHPWQILDSSASPAAIVGGQNSRAVPQTPPDTKQALRALVRNALDLPKPPPRADAETPEEDPRSHLADFYRERQPALSFAIVGRVFRAIFGDHKFPRLSFRVIPFEQDVLPEWPRDCSTPVAAIVDRLRPAYAWPDKLAVLYAERYRSAFILSFVLGSIAVGLALLPVGAQSTPHGRLEMTSILLELVAIVAILVIVQLGRHGRWHQRWIDYRLAAELVRGLPLVAPLGGARPFPQIPAHWASYGQPGATWMAWYVRALERDLGLPSVRLDAAHLEDCLGRASEILKRQIEFHADNALRCHRIEKKLHRLGIVLLGLTLLACVLHLVPGIPQYLSPLFTFCCGFFPALGAGLAGILNQGEFRRLTKRSKSMAEQLPLLWREIETLRGNIQLDPAMKPYSQRAVSLANDTARFLIQEVLDWRVVFLDRPLVEPS